MPVWTCPNTECTFDKQLLPGERCPLCGKEAKEFKFGEFGNLLKEKKDVFKKSKEQTKGNKRVLERMKVCPKCGSINISLPVFYRPSIWKCLDCGYEGAFVVEGHKLAERIKNKEKGG